MCPLIEGSALSPGWGDRAMCSVCWMAQSEHTGVHGALARPSEHTERGHQEWRGDVIPLASPGNRRQIWKRGPASQSLGGEWKEGAQGDFGGDFKIASGSHLSKEGVSAQMGRA